MNDRAGKNRARPNRAGSANFTEGSAGGSAESRAKKVAKIDIILGLNFGTTFWYFLVVKREYFSRSIFICSYTFFTVSENSTITILVLRGAFRTGSEISNSKFRQINTKV